MSRLSFPSLFWPPGARRANADAARGKAWNAALNRLPAGKREEFERRLRGDLPASFGEAVIAYKRKLAEDRSPIATRKASQATLEVLAQAVPELLTGSADLTPSNNTKVAATPEIGPSSYAGRYIHWGVREHGMAAAVNGIALHGGFIPSGASFLTFSDYCRPALRLSALMGIRAIEVFTHDSIGLGEDGPTHQPVEHLAALRAIPNLLVFRPADRTETLECWQLALQAKTSPSILALTRQNLPTVRNEFTPENLSAAGAYELAPAEGGPAKVSIFASGSEVSIALDARSILAEQGIATRVVSVPCMDLFLQQDRDQRQKIIGDAPVRVGVEAAVRQGWDAIIGEDGIFIGMTGFWRQRALQGCLQLFQHYAGSRRRGRDAALQQLTRANNNPHAKRDSAAPAGPPAEKEKQWRLESLSTDLAASAAISCARLPNQSARTFRLSSINDLGPVETNAHLLRFDSVHGRFPGDIKVAGDSIDYGEGPVKVTAIRDPRELPHKELAVDIALECTGFFTSKDKAAAHLKAGAKRVLISAAADHADLTVVFGVNHAKLTKDHLIVSNASCTTNCLAPVAKILNDAIGIETGFMTTIHSYTGDQPVLDTMHKDLYRARAAALSMIPTSTGAARAIGLVLPELNGKLDGAAIRVPTPNVSVVDFKFVAKRKTTADEIKDTVKRASENQLKGILTFTESPNVSADFNHDPHSSIFHMDQTRVMEGTFVRVLSWYDNEWGFSNRMIDVAAAMGKLI